VQIAGVDQRLDVPEMRVGIRAARGVTLVELVVVVTVMGVLISLGMPMFRTWSQNAKIRGTTESLYNGLQIARGEAIKTNTTACLYSLNDVNGNDTNGGYWCVRRGRNDGVGCDAASEIQRHDSTAIDTVSVTLLMGALPVCFSGTGARPLGSAQTNFQIQLAPAVGVPTDEHRTLQIRVTPMGGLRSCDPALLATDPRACV
jgi:type IV fimbrial biogenesis protein FimT